MNLTFSQRIGVTPIRDSFQVTSLDKDSRNAIWNLLHYCVFEHETISNNSRFWEGIWVFFLNQPADEISIHYDDFRGIIRSNGVKNIIRDNFFNNEWWWVLNFLQYLVSEYESDLKIEECLNKAFEKEKISYRFISGILSPITSQTEISEIEAAANDDQYSGASFHISEALRMLSDRQNPDYRNSVKESISAVESVAKIITGKPDATLGPALNELKKNNKIHSRLIAGFEGLYSYTNDKENGIRHAYLDDKTEITIADAQYFLVSCSAFVNYLKTLNAK